MKFATFDLEIAEPLTDDNKYTGQPISCAAIATSEGVKFYQNWPHMKQVDCDTLLADIITLNAQGYSLVTWNGCGFDFKVLAHQSGMPNEVMFENREHIDLMFHIMCVKGYPVALDKVLTMIGGSKQHVVTLKSGEQIREMSGKFAPELWQAGETEAVLSYLREDVVQLLKLTEAVDRLHEISWPSKKSGQKQTIKMDEFLTVDECLALPLPDTSWMTGTQLTRETFTGWMKEFAK